MTSCCTLMAGGWGKVLTCLFYLFLHKVPSWLNWRLYSSEWKHARLRHIHPNEQGSIYSTHRRVGLVFMFWPCKVWKMQCVLCCQRQLSQPFQTLIWNFFLTNYFPPPHRFIDGVHIFTYFTICNWVSLNTACSKASLYPTLTSCSRNPRLKARTAGSTAVRNPTYSPTQDML